MGSGEDCEAKGNERKERGLKKMLAKIVRKWYIKFG